MFIDGEQKAKAHFLVKKKDATAIVEVKTKINCADPRLLLQSMKEK
jgi:hypothetical protein